MSRSFRHRKNRARIPSDSTVSSSMSSPTSTSAAIEETIERYWRHLEYGDALTLAELLYSRKPTSNSCQLLARSLYFSGFKRAAFKLIREHGFSDPELRYFYAKVAYELDENDAAEKALCQGRDIHPSLKNTPHESFSRSLMSQIKKETNEPKVALKQVNKSLLAEPLRWSNIKTYFELGGCVASTTKSDYNRSFDESTEKENYEPLDYHTVKMDVQETLKLCENDKDYDEMCEYYDRMMAVQARLAAFKLEEAVDALNLLPEACMNQPLTLELLGRVLFEKAEYQRAAEAFDTLRTQYPHRIEGMEIYSSCLWQIQDGNRLSKLSKELTEEFRHRPEAWCAAGNLYSIEKQCAVAADCFDRATHLHPKCGYAYCLLGHELIEVGHLDEAEAAFHAAKRLSPHDYRPSLGFGMIDNRRSLLSRANEEPCRRSALTHMRNAVNLNPNNILLQCHLAVTEQSNGNDHEALRVLNNALKKLPFNVAARYHKARILFDTKRYEAARDELLQLKELSPMESHIFFLLARTYKKLGDGHRALVYFNFSTEIDPLGEQSRGIYDESYDEDELDPDQVVNMP